MPIKAKITTDLDDLELDLALLDLAAERYGGYAALEKAAGDAVEFEGEAGDIADPMLRAAAENAYRLVGEPLKVIETELVERLFGKPLRKAKEPGVWWAPPKYWRELVARLIKKYFPEVEGTSKFLAYQGTLLGYLGPYYGGPKKALPAVWTELKALTGKVAVPNFVAEQIKYAEELAGSYLTGTREGLQEGVNRLIVNYLRGGTDKRGLQRMLGEEFGYKDRDWRRVAVTETAAYYNNGKLMTLAGGTYVYTTLSPKPCTWCKANLEGKVFIKVDAPRADDQVEDDPYGAVRYVWPGKSNYGRSASPTTRDGRARSEDELWWACCPAHCNCVHSWFEFNPKAFYVDTETGRLEVIRR